MTELETIRKYLSSKKGVTEEMPFGPDVLVYKVLGKMYALLGWKNDPLTVNLKCDPDEAMALRTLYPAVKPGYHMNKDHWNTVMLDGSIPEEHIRRMIDESYFLIVRKLKKSDRDKLGIT